MVAQVEPETHVAEKLPINGMTHARSRAKSLLIMASILGLVFLNIATLVSDGIHMAGYSMIRSVLGAAVSEAMLTRMLSRSPVAVRKNEVVRATQLSSRKIDELTMRNRILDEKFSRLDREHRDISAKHAQLKAANARQASAVQTVSTKARLRFMKTAARNVAALPGEAIPLAGIGLAVAVTAWDIYDLCETIKDFNQVNAAFGLPLEDDRTVCGIKIPSREAVMADMRKNWQSAYKTAASVVNQAGTTMTSMTPPVVTWNEMKATVCPLLQTPKSLCH